MMRLISVQGIWLGLVAGMLVDLAAGGVQVKVTESGFLCTDGKDLYAT